MLRLSDDIVTFSFFFQDKEKVHMQFNHEELYKFYEQVRIYSNLV